MQSQILILQLDPPEDKTIEQSANIEQSNTLEDNDEFTIDQSAATYRFPQLF